MVKKGLALTLAVAMAWAVAAPAFAQGNPFRDVPLDHWAYDAIAELASAGLVEGYPDGTFGGERTFTRYEMAMVFARILARFEALIQDEIASTVDDKVAALQAAIDALAEERGVLPDGRPAIAVERVEREDGTVEAAVRLSPEMQDAIRAVVADQLREELEVLEPEVLGALREDPEAVRALVDERAGTLGGAILSLAQEFHEELDLLGVRVAELEQLFEHMNARLEAVEQRVAEAASAAETARGIADAAQAAAAAAEEAARQATARADAAWDLVSMLQEQQASADEVAEASALAASAQEAADAAQERAYRARLAAEEAAALAAAAQEQAERAAAVGEMARDDAAAALATAEDAIAQATAALEEAARQGEQARAEALAAMERAQRADQQAYRARLTADRALEQVEALDEQVVELAQRPRIGGELGFNYELTHTSDATDPDGVPLDPRQDPDDEDTEKIESKEDFSATVSLNAAFEPAEGVQVEGGIRAKAQLFASGSDPTFDLTGMHVQVTTAGSLRSAYFGSMTGERLADGFNKFTLDPETYEAKVDEEDRGGAVIEGQLGSLSGRIIASRLNSDDQLVGLAGALPLDDGLTVEGNYLWWSSDDRVASVRAFGEAGGFDYDWLVARYKDHPAADGRVSGSIGNVDLNFTYGWVDEAFAPADPDEPKREELSHFGKLLRDEDDELEAGHGEYVLEAALPLGLLTAVYEKGRHDDLTESEFTDWHKAGFRDLDVLGFQIGALYYTDDREGDKETEAYRVDVSRGFTLGLPFTVRYSLAQGEYTDWAEDRTHETIAVSVDEYALNDTVTVSAGYKTERNPIEDDEWTDPEKWDLTFEDDDDDESTTADDIVIRNRDTWSGSVRFALSEALSLTADHVSENWDTDGDRDVDAGVSTTTVGADYSLTLGKSEITLGYGYQTRSVFGNVAYEGDPRTMYSVGVTRDVFGATLNAWYKVIKGRGEDHKDKAYALDTMASVSLTYPITESMDFTLSGRWADSTGNGGGTYKDYYYASVKAGLGIEF